MSDKWFAVISFSSFSGDPSFSFVWGIFSFSPHFNCLFVFVSMYLICFHSLSCGVALHVGVLWVPVVQTLWSLDLDTLRMFSVWVMWTLCCVWILNIIGPFADGNSLPGGWLRVSTLTMCCCYCTGTGITKHNNTKTSKLLDHHSKVNNKRAKNNKSRKINGVVEKGEKENWYEQT